MLPANLKKIQTTKEIVLPRQRDWIDYSTLSSYISCSNKCLLQYILNIRPTHQALELVFGGSQHFALELAYQVWADQGKLDPRDLRAIAFDGFQHYWETFAGDFASYHEDHLFPRSPGNARAMLGSYFQTHYENDRHLSLVGTEVPFEFLFRLSDGATIKYIGRIDRIMSTKEGQLHAFEIKTSSVLGPVILFGYEQSFQSDGYLRFLHSFTDATQKREAPTLFYDILAVQKTSQTCQRHEIRKLQGQVEASFSVLSQWVLRFYQDLSGVLGLLSSSEEWLYNRDLTLPFFLRSKGTACTEYMRACPYADICRARANPLTYLVSRPMGYDIRAWDPRNHEREVNKAMSSIYQKYNLNKMEDTPHE